MNIGIPTETKPGEARVGLTPTEVRALVAAGHMVRVQAGAGAGVRISDDAYHAAGAQIVNDGHALWSQSTIIAKVKEIQPDEIALLKREHILCGFAQLARDRAMLTQICGVGTNIVAYECVRDAHGGTPILAPMSRIAGAMCPSVAAWCLQHAQGGAGLLIDAQTRVTIVGLGVSALAAAEGFTRAGAHVTLVYRNELKARALSKRMPQNIHFVPTPQLAEIMPRTDVLIGAAAEPGTLSPKLITRAMLRTMARGRVFIDIGIDMGGIAETSRQTSWNAPIYVEEGVVHFCVPNLPAQVPATATAQLAAAALPTVLAIANEGLDAAMVRDAGLAAAVQVRDGKIVDARLR
jgi:alanine dehydrogenase